MFLDVDTHAYDIRDTCEQRNVAPPEELNLLINYNLFFDPCC